MHGFTNAFEQNEIDLPEDCMDFKFQEKFMVNLNNVFLDIIDGDIFNPKVLDQHILILLSSVGNELINGCNSSRIIVELSEYFDEYFGNQGFIAGVWQTARDLTTHLIANPQTVLLWSSVMILSMPTFQFYWLGFSMGKLARIFFFNES